MRHVLNSMVAAALAGAPAAATQAQPAGNTRVANPLPAASPWRLDHGAERCELARTFGAGTDAITLYLRQSAPGQFFDLTLAGAALGKPRAAFGTKARYGTLEQREFKDSAWVALANDGRPALLLGRNTFSEWDNAGKRWVLATPEVLKTIAKLEFDIPRAAPLALITGPMDKPMAALAGCMEAMVTRWGFEPGRQATLAKQAAPLNSPGKWIAPADYPGALGRQGQGALLDLRLVIAANGAIESCTIQNAVGDADFAKLTCDAIMRRARFSPALDASGSPVRSLYFNSARFETR